MPSRQLVVAGFAVLVAGVLVVTLSAVIQVRALQTNARDVVRNMLLSVRLVGQLANLLERRRILVDDHIFSSDPAERASIERKLTAMNDDIASTSRAYDPWANLPNERLTWQRTRADLAALDDPVARALGFSRQNRDAQARHEMQLVRGQFEIVGRDFAQLIAINDQGATDALRRFSLIRVRLMLTLLGMGLSGLLGTLVVGRWVWRRVARQEETEEIEKRALEVRNQELDAFAGRVAHDLRGPLTAISLAAMQLDARTGAERRPLDVVNRSLRRMETLVGDLLALSRLEAQAHGHCDPADVVAQVQEDLSARIQAEKGALRVAVNHADVSCSEGLLRQAVTNLIENAMKYHRPEVAPEVEVSGEATNAGYDLRVSDNGLGMSKEDAARAFEPFFRSLQAQDVPGTGLGLSIVNRVARANGGALSVETRLGRGSTFVVHLPLANGHHGG